MTPLHYTPERDRPLANKKPSQWLGMVEHPFLRNSPVGYAREGAIAGDYQVTTRVRYTRIVDPLYQTLYSQDRPWPPLSWHIRYKVYVFRGVSFGHARQLPFKGPWYRSLLEFTMSMAANSVHLALKSMYRGPSHRYSENRDE